MLSNWRDISWQICNQGKKVECTFPNRNKLRLYKARKIYVVEFRLGSDPANCQFNRYASITEARKKYEKIISELGGSLLYAYNQEEQFQLLKQA